MQVKVCPKCAAENKPTNASCSNCYSSLEGVPETLSNKAQEPVLVRPSSGTRVPERPDSAPQTGAMGSASPPYGPPPGQQGYSPYNRERPAPAPKKSSPIVAIILILVLLGGGGFAGWWFLMKPAGPEQVVQQFMDAAKEGSVDKVKECLTQSSINMIQAFGGEQAFADSLKKQAGMGSGLTGTINKTTYEGDNAIVEFEPAEKSQLPPGMKSSEIVLVKENDKWKIDLMATVTRQLKKMFGKDFKMPMPKMGR